MYIIVKQVCGFKYYWNEVLSQWEGIIDNASFFESDDYSQKIFVLENRFNEILSYVKI